MADDFGMEAVMGDEDEGFEFPKKAIPVCKRCGVMPAMMNRKTGKVVNGLCGHCRNEITKEKTKRLAGEKTEGGGKEIGQDDRIIAMKEKKDPKEPVIPSKTPGPVEAPVREYISGGVKEGVKEMAKRYVGPWPVPGFPPPAPAVDDAAMVKEAEKLVDEHWRYVEGLLKVYGQPTVTAEYVYRTAFIHGLKHGVELRLEVG